MANDLNQCNFIGRLGKDVDMRYMPSGEAVASFSIAVGSQRKDKATGEKRESTEWVNMSAFGKLGEICGQYLSKGSRVFISGRLKTEKWTDKEGIDRYSTKIVADRMQMLDSKSDSDSGSQEYPTKPRSAPQQCPQDEAAERPASSGFDDMDDDIPF